MKLKKSQVIADVYKIPELQFEDHQAASLTSFAGLVIYQTLFQRLKIKQRLQDCFQHLTSGSIYLHVWADGPLAGRASAAGVFECDWKPESWLVGFRILVIRQKKTVPNKGPLQLDLFEPKSHEYQYQVVITNKKTTTGNVMEFHHGLGSQEAIFAETKSHCRMEYIPVRTLCGNQTYCLAAILAHNLTRELQMGAGRRSGRSSSKRGNLWGFETLNTLRQRLLHRAGRLIRPQGRLTLITAANKKVRDQFHKYLSP